MARNTGDDKNGFLLDDQTKIIALAVVVVLLAFVFFYAKTQPQPAQEVSQPEQIVQAQPEQKSEEVKPIANADTANTFADAKPLRSSGQRMPAYAYPSSNHFGIVNAKQDYSAITEIGVTWDRPYPGPFNWEKIGFDKYDWATADKYVQGAQEHGLNTLAIIWPYNQIDQDRCYKGETEIEFGELVKDLATRRRKPCDTDAYKNFVRATVERYDADGVADMPGLKYGIKYWEVASTPEVQLSAQGKVFFQGAGKDYAEALKASYAAIKSADAGAKVLNGGVSRDGIGSTFWADVFLAAKDYFDIANYHCDDCDDSARIQEFKNFLKQNNIDKPVWLTSITFMGDSDKEQAMEFFKGYLNAFGKGVDKIFYERWNEPLGGKLALANIIHLPSTKKQVHGTFAALVKKLDNFSSAKEVSDGYFEFSVNEKKVYAFLKTYDLPKEIAGKVTKMDFNGTEKKVTMYNVASSDIPIIIEKA